MYAFQLILERLIFSAQLVKFGASGLELNALHVTHVSQGQLILILCCARARRLLRAGVVFSHAQAPDKALHDLRGMGEDEAGCDEHDESCKEMKKKSGESGDAA
jgi:hypothetical protein